MVGFVSNLRGPGMGPFCLFVVYRRNGLTPVKGGAGTSMGSYGSEKNKVFTFSSP